MVTNLRGHIAYKPLQYKRSEAETPVSQTFEDIIKNLKQQIEQIGLNIWQLPKIKNSFHQGLKSLAENANTVNKNPQINIDATAAIALTKTAKASNNRETKLNKFTRSLADLLHIWILCGIEEAATRTLALAHSHAVFRLKDDISDGDTHEPNSAQNRQQYIQQRVNHLTTPEVLDESEPIDALFIKTLKLFDQLGLKESVHPHLVMLANSILFDVNRVVDFETSETGTFQFQKQKELDQNFHNMDIMGTGVPTMLLFGLENSNINKKIIEPLGRYARLIYDLEDLDEDIKAGLCNISAEEAETFNITQADLAFIVNDNISTVNQLPENIKNWAYNRLNTAHLQRTIFEKRLAQKKPEMQESTGGEGFMRGVKRFLYSQIVIPEVFKRAYITPAEKAVEAFFNQPYDQAVQEAWIQERSRTIKSIPTTKKGPGTNIQA